MMPIAVMPVSKIVMSIHTIMITTMMGDILVEIITVVVTVAPVIPAVQTTESPLSFPVRLAVIIGVPTVVMAALSVIRAAVMGPPAALA